MTYFTLFGCNSMVLLDQIKEIESKVGAFSNYQFWDGVKSFPSQKFKFEKKPAQLMLSQLGAKADPNAMLTTASAPFLHENNPSIKISVPGSAAEFMIDGGMIDALLRSGTVFVNTDIFPQGVYSKLVQSNTLTAQDKSICKESNIHWQNLATAVCHSQRIVLLIDQHIGDDGLAYSTYKTGAIDFFGPTIQLLSAPALNFSYGVAGELTSEQRHNHIVGMYRNLFSAAEHEGSEYIVMPAAGMGAFCGDPHLYFECLMSVAQEFPKLNIVYHPAKFSAEFDEALHHAKLPNVVKATKDVMFIADALCKDGHPVALHNPSDCDVIYGVYDVGEYWKTGTGSGYVCEEHIGSMTTATLNSRGINPAAYQNIVERKFNVGMTFYKQAFHAQVQLLKSLLPLDEPFAVTINKLHDALILAGKTFFADPTPKTFAPFVDSCIDSLCTAKIECIGHDGLWAGLHPILRGILGVLAALTVLPMLIVSATSEKGYWHTFFAPYLNETTVDIATIQDNINELCVSMEANGDKLYSSVKNK